MGVIKNTKFKKIIDLIEENSPEEQRYIVAELADHFIMLWAGWKPAMYPESRVHEEAMRLFKEWQRCAGYGVLGDPLRCLACGSTSGAGVGDRTVYPPTEREEINRRASDLINAIEVAKGGKR
jgi:hypothetical protein